MTLRRECRRNSWICRRCSSPASTTPTGKSTARFNEYGSFLQSRMHQAGVTCADCHDPHSAKLRADGNALCAQCHMPAKFDVAEHHHHQPGSAGAKCVNCHMPTKNFMVVDARRDHSIWVPRPDLSVALGTPNACTQCHTESSAEWAAQTVAGWYPRGRQTTQDYGSALHAGRMEAADAEQQPQGLPRQPLCSLSAGFPSSSPNSRSPVVNAAMPACCAVSPAPSSSFLTIGASNRSTPAPVVTSTKSSKNVTGAPRHPHQPDPVDKWPDLCRRHPRPPRPQRPSHRSRRRQPETQAIQIDSKGLTTGLQLAKKYCQQGARQQSDIIK